MGHSIIEWLWQNKTEVAGAILGILYVILSVRQNILTWPTGLLTSFLYIVVFYKSGLYAAMGLQTYYVAISIYGWYFWLNGKRNENENALSVSRATNKIILSTILVSILLYGILFLFLNRFTDSDVPHFDAFTTAWSISATWMLAKKHIETWIIWMVVDVLSIGLYVHKNLWPTAILFIVYTVMAVWGWLEWQKDLNKKHESIS